MFDIESIKFDKNGLVPAIAVNAYTNEVLMQAFMNKTSLKLTIDTWEAYYFSRSRNKLWHKGETSGHIQKVVSIIGLRQRFDTLARYSNRCCVPYGKLYLLF